VSLLGKHRGKIADIRPRRFIGILERALLGTAMGVVLSIVERRMSRRSTSAVRDTPSHQTEEERRAT
jgi:hypothetical protein